MRRWAISALLLWGCGEDGLDSAEPGAQDGGVPADGGVIPPVCDPDQEAANGRCVDPPEDPCAFAADNADLCDDLDGDCFVGACRGLSAGFIRPVRDCDDRRPDVNPGVDEVCDVVDQDCDGRTDEGYAVGDECDACEVAGKTECAFDDLDAVACSTAFGQSSAPEAAEACNDLDDDCDGAVDEGCADPLPAGEVGAPALCATGVVYTVSGVVRWVPDEGEPLELGQDAVSPACGPTHLAWLSVAGDCAGAADTPPRCTLASLMVHALDGETRDLTGAAALGAPLIDAEWVYWHAVSDGMPTLRRAPLVGGGVESIGGVEPLSDPAAPGEDGVIARRWEAVPQTVLVGEATRVLPQPTAPSGAPAANADWVVWTVGAPAEALWAAPRTDLDGAFQALTGRFDAVGLAGARVVWLDAGVLTTFELQTGARTQLATGVEAFAADDRRAVWVETRDGQPALVQWWWP